ncbi:1-deoxy-D-xylulose-5-phosphate reductoisomerase [Helicobacter canis]|uniref:1-deoxy-D-xylulose-5-phosphate reductoisomerase n=1 Tax=Helicobacter canis TaxID=29419 RepID=UPI0029434973|nr:1-deoxy-D-xylulose-5-phosphate reductoisomerase [Helicobacter canis]
MIILGSTGSIGIAALKIASLFSYKIEALAAGRNIALLNQQILAHRPKLVCIADERDLGQLEARGARVFVGESGICEMLEAAHSALVVNAIVGFAGLKPSLHTQYCKKTLALANKESLVAGGWLLDTKAIMPIDSEHFGLWYLRTNRAIKRLVITASGGAFRDTPIHTIKDQTKSAALRHPNWQMGQKITIDSASMMNKIFEILEAYWLFGCKDIEALIERSSSVHALIEFIDGSTTAHFALPDMRLPIAYAIDPKQASTTSIIPSMDLSQILAITFDPIDTNRYPLYELKDALLENPKLGVIVNASNEQAISHFLQDKITFGAIYELVKSALEVFAPKLPELESYTAIATLDKEVRQWCDEAVKHRTR